MVAVFILLIAVIAVVLWLIGAYNGLVQLKLRVTNGWAQIDVQLKRRHDLIPNLVETAKGYMKFEKETLENVIKARTQATQATSVKDKEGAENLLKMNSRKGSFRKPLPGHITYPCTCGLP